MDYVELLKQTFKITFKYRVLWVFGFLLALCGGAGGNGGFNSPGNFSNFSEGYNGGVPFSGPGLSDSELVLIAALVFVFLCLFLVFAVVGVVVRAVTRTALIGMVAQIEKTEHSSLGDGWRFGWSGKAWRLFLLNLLIAVPLSIVLLASLILVALPVLAGILGDETFLIMGAVISLGLFFMWIFFSMLLGLAVMPFRELGQRYAVLEDEGPIQSLRHSYHLLRAQPKDVIVTTLIMVGVALIWGFINFIIVLVWMLGSLLVAAIPAVAAYMLTQEPMAAALAAAPLFLLVFVFPMILVQGIYLVYHSGAWTLAFRNLLQLEKEAPPPDDANPEQLPSPEPVEDEQPDEPAAAIEPADIILDDGPDEEDETSSSDEEFDN